MRVVGFTFKKISIERLKEASKESISVKTNIDVPELKEIKTHVLKTKDNLLNVSFKYNINYEPSFAEVSLEGNIVVTIDPKTHKEVMKEWKKKKLPSDFRMFIFNMILKKSTLKALQLEEELNLPLHMPIPSFKKSNKK